MSNNEIKALINLLDDPDDIVYSQIKDKIISIGHVVIPHLEQAWEQSLNGLLQNRIEDIIHHLQFENVKLELANWRKSDDLNLVEGATILAHYQYPDLDKEEINQFIEKLSKDVWLEVNDNLTALEYIKVINKIVFEIYGFHGNTKNVNSPKNSYINNVIETKRGNPLTLGIIYLAVCEHLQLPVFGVNIPQHFILTYFENGENLFYINIFNKGIVFGKEDIDKFLFDLKIEAKPTYYNPCSKLTIMKRLVEHLIISYDQMGYLEKKEELNQLFKILTNPTA